MTIAGTRRTERSGPISIKETTMNRLLYCGAMLVVLGTAGAATAQNANDAAQSNNAHPNLNPVQQQMISNSLSSTPSQSAPRTLRSFTTARPR